MSHIYSSIAYSLGELTRHDATSWCPLVFAGVVSAAAVALSLSRRTSVGVRTATALWGAGFACLAWGAFFARLVDINAAFRFESGEIPSSDAAYYSNLLQKELLEWRLVGVAAGLLLAIAGWVVMLRREKNQSLSKPRRRGGWGFLALGGWLALVCLLTGKISAEMERVEGQDIRSTMAPEEGPLMIAITELQAQYADAAGAFLAAWSLALTVGLSGTLFARRRKEWVLTAPLPAAESALGAS